MWIGDKIYFASDRDGTLNLYVYDLASQAVDKLTNSLPKDVAPGQTIDLTIGLTSPLTPGGYFGYWKLQNPAGGLFGIGQTASQPFFVEIEVVNKAAPVYDFAANAPSAIWGTEASGRRPFRGFYGNPDGRFVQTVDRPVLETGIPTNGTGILMSPPAEYNEHIYGIFPAYEIKQGDRFQSLIGCEYGSVNCEVKFALQYQNPEGGGTRSNHTKFSGYFNHHVSHDGETQKKIRAIRKPIPVIKFRTV